MSLALRECLQSGSRSFADCTRTDADELIRVVYWAVLIRRAGPGRAGAVVGEVVIVLMQGAEGVETDHPASLPRR